jgi:non-ribosomal peptide synthetase component F
VLFTIDLFEPKTIQGMVAVFQKVLRRVLKQPQTPITVLPLTNGLVDLHSMGLLEIERTDYPRGSSVVDIFRKQAAAYPDATAVKDSSSQLTYAQLDRQSDKVATWLRRRSIPAKTLVGVLAPRSCQTIIAFLGILKANLAYLPLDVNIPTPRIKAILSSVAGHKLVLLGQDVLVPDFQLADVELVRIGETLGHPRPNDATDNSIGPSATSLTYVMFTSRSTGRPKGVIVEHRSIIQLVRKTNLVPAAEIVASIAHISNLAFNTAT